MIDNSGLEKSLDGIRYIDLFAGIGAFRQAFDSFGAECVFTSEINEDCQLVYAQNYGDKPAGDITKIEAGAIPAFNVLCAGFPCQSFAIAGKQLGFDDPRGQLFFEICRIAEAHRPPLMILENVPNLLAHDNGETFRIVKAHLHDLDYDVAHEVLNASDFGVPQARRRVFLVCSRSGLGRFEFPRPTKTDITLSDVLLSPEETSRWNVALENRRPVLSRNLVARCQRLVRVGTVNCGGMGERIYHANGHASTLTKGGGGVGSKTGLYLVGDVVRRLSPRECARISGFPETFQLHSNDREAQSQFGNSIVVDVLQHIIKALVEQGVFRQISAKYPCATLATANTDKADLYDRLTEEDNMSIEQKIVTATSNLESASPVSDALPHHPIADFFPRFTENELAELAEDIAANGQREPGIVWNGKLLDGLNRQLACKRKNILFEWVTRNFADENEAVAFVISANIHRRHLDESQRAMIGAKLMDFLSAAKATDSNVGNGTLKSRDKAAVALNVSPRLIQDARKVLSEGVPELDQAVSSGQVSVSAAALVASLPKDQQIEILNTPDGVKAAAKKVRNDKKMAANDSRNTFPTGTEGSLANPLKNTGSSEENKLSAEQEQPKASPAEQALIKNRLRYLPNDAEIDRAVRIFCDANAAYPDCEVLAARLLGEKHPGEAGQTWTSVEEFATKMRQAYENLNKENPSNG